MMVAPILLLQLMFLLQQELFFCLPNAVVPNAKIRISAGSKVEVSKKTSQ
jgi:hypothetical protein